MSKEILLHICCAPCATAVVERLREEDYKVTGYFYNPSIHPWKELQRRLEALDKWASQVDLQVTVVQEYRLEENIRMLLDADNRCQECFNDRLLATATEAESLNIDLFSTTLTVSPYQNQQMIKTAGERAAEITGVGYVHKDFRDYYKGTIEISRRFNLYRQPYCGCVFSERDRYLKQKSPGEK